MANLQRLVHHAADLERVVRARLVENQQRHPFPESAEGVVLQIRAACLSFHLDRHGLWRHRLSNGRLRRSGRHVHQRDGVAGIQVLAEVGGAFEGLRRIRRGAAFAVRKYRRKEVAERADLRAGVRAGTGHDQIFLQRLGGYAHALLHVGDFGLRRKEALSGVHEAEHRAGDSHHDRGCDEHFDGREAALMVFSRGPNRHPSAAAALGTPPRSAPYARGAPFAPLASALPARRCDRRHHWTFLDRIVINRASWAPRETDPRSPVPRSRLRVTST